MPNTKIGGRGVTPEWAISRLGTLPEPLFSGAVLQLLSGGRITDFARYIQARTVPGGPLSNCSKETLRRYLSAMSLRLKEWLSTPSVETAPHWLKKVMDAVSTDSDCSRDIRGSDLDEMKRAAHIRHVDALTLLKINFLAGVQRHESLRAMESKYGILLPAAMENICALLKVATEIRKIELMDAFPRLKQSAGRRIIRDAVRPVGSTGHNIAQP